MEASGAKKRKFQCEICQQTFDRLERLQKHQKNPKIPCNCCSKKFCNFDQHQKHLRTQIKPVTSTVNINQRIQPLTFYNGDAGFQAIRLGKLQEIQDWEKYGRKFKIINRAINHKFTYKDLRNLIIEVYIKINTALKL